jgi:predicted transglutaminase-like protease
MVSIRVSENKITLGILLVVTSNVCNNTLNPFYKINAFCMVNHCLIKSCIFSKILLHSVGLITGVTTFTVFAIGLLYPVTL